MHPINEHSLVEDGNYLNAVLCTMSPTFFLAHSTLRLQYSNWFSTLHAVVCYLGSGLAELSGRETGWAGLQCSMVELHRLLTRKCRTLWSKLIQEYHCLLFHEHGKQNFT